MTMRQILHPGPAASERTSTVVDTPVPLRFMLEAGLTVDQAIAKGFAAHGCLGGFVHLSGDRFEPFKYVMPASSPDASHAAWYSETFEPRGPVEIVRAGAIVGWRDEKPFLHCHGIWDTQAGRRMGHMLAPDTIVLEPIEATGIGTRHATFKALPDPETNFTLFEPIQISQERMAEGPRVILAKVRPNEDISLAIERICTEYHIKTAKIHGIGSLNEVYFTSGAHVASHATEVLISEGDVSSADGRPQARLHLDVVDIDGRISTGEIVHGDNPVCVTFELVIEVAE